MKMFHPKFSLRFVSLQATGGKEDAVAGSATPPTIAFDERKNVVIAWMEKMGFVGGCGKIKDDSQWREALAQFGGTIEDVEKSMAEMSGGA
jgi:hypothetical protein